MERCDCPKCKELDMKARAKAYFDIHSKDKVEIVTEDWDYECGDGCCSDYGTNLYVNGYQVTDRFDGCGQDIVEVVKLILGKNFNVTYEHNYGEEE